MTVSNTESLSAKVANLERELKQCKSVFTTPESVKAGGLQDINGRLITQDSYIKLWYTQGSYEGLIICAHVEFTQGMLTLNPYDISCVRNPFSWKEGHDFTNSRMFHTHIGYFPESSSRIPHARVPLFSIAENWVVEDITYLNNLCAQHGHTPLIIKALCVCPNCYGEGTISFGSPATSIVCPECSGHKL